jgi:hypothetical protein
MLFDLRAAVRHKHDQDQFATGNVGNGIGRHANEDTLNDVWEDDTNNI